MIETIYRPLNWLFAGCCELLNNYVLAIVVFTFLTKVILFPIGLWTHRNGLKMVSLMPELNRLKMTYYGDKETIAEETQKLYKKVGYHPLASMIPMCIQLFLLGGVVGAVREVLGQSGSVLTLVPSEAGGITYLMPTAAGCAALLLGVSQNHLNPLQREQVKAEQLTTNGISVAISLVLGVFVPLGVGLYWISGNLFAILQQMLANAIIKPQKYIDYETLKRSRAELANMNSLSPKATPEEKRREKADYKRFFSIANKHLVFYSEKSGFYKYFQNTIEYLLAHSNVVIHYVTNDPEDQIFELAKRQTRIRPYYISQTKTITLFMKMDADIVVMTTPDLENYYLKRSYVRKDIEYIYITHGMTSITMCVRKGALDHFDTILCAGPHYVGEIRETEAMYGLPPKNLVPCGYGLLDNLIKGYEELDHEEDSGGRKRILIAPSWQEGNILDSCVDELIVQLDEEKYFIVVRPHPEYIKRFPGKMKSLQARYQTADPSHLMIESDFSSNITIFTADLVITDWSGIAYEFTFATKKPALFINTPMKVLNPDYDKYKNLPLDISLRDQVGVSLDLDKVHHARSTVDKLLAEHDAYKQKIEEVFRQCVFNIGSSGVAAGQYILKSLQGKVRGGSN